MCRGVVGDLFRSAQCPGRPAAGRGGGATGVMPSGSQCFARHAPGRTCIGGSVQTPVSALFEEAHALLINNLMFIAELNSEVCLTMRCYCTKKWHFQ
eukprot:gene322-379_t